MTIALPGAPDAASWEALQRGALLTELPRVGGLRVVGDDRASFLHGQLAHEVRGLPPGSARRTLQLDVKGHALAEMAVHVRDDDVHLAVEDDAAAAVAERLRRHLVFDRVEVEELPDVLATLTLQGPRARAVLEAAGGSWPESGRFAALRVGDATLLVVPHRRSGPGGVDVHLLARQRDAAIAALRAAGALEGGPGAIQALEASRVAARLARAGSEAGPGVLPQEAGLDALLSTRKGCYLGQEIMARLEARGRLKRGLALLELGDDGPRDEGSAGRDDRAVLSDGREVGRLGTPVRHPEAGPLALAVLRLDLPADAELRAGGRRARQRPSPPGSAAAEG